MVFIPEKPTHTKFALANLNTTQYKIYAKQYSREKASGIRSIYVWSSGVGILRLVSDVSKGIYSY